MYLSIITSNLIISPFPILQHFAFILLPHRNLRSVQYLQTVSHTGKKFRIKFWNWKIIQAEKNAFPMKTIETNIVQVVTKNVIIKKLLSIKFYDFYGYFTIVHLDADKYVGHVIFMFYELSI